eukprot:CAMPEP_0115090796 /NCGR_PEP_ID=MMETSP0227-20121206/25674_1 /TAXON_ID=89957 /ORGANISM="Polarella glacialis, Strain CCMP 1383" /LENGTH=480 /DNA_ID=CAMNT_0002482073 /DNA_START=151 /DNA_END=1593 /DNA_ORIENTATION=+
MAHGAKTRTYSELSRTRQDSTDSDPSSEKKLKRHLADFEDDDDEDDESGAERGGKGRKESNVCADGAVAYLRTVAREFITGSYLNVLFLAFPVAFVAKQQKWSEAVIFMASLTALIPCAERVSFVTEDIAKYTNDTVGGLLNATFGNVTEVVICIYLIQADLFRVVQLSLLGSVLSNLLLVLGSAFFVGGLRYREQRFNKTAAVTNSGLLVVAVLALSLPSILDATHEGAGGVHEAIVKGNVQEMLVGPGGRLLSHAKSDWWDAKGNLEAEVLPGGDAPLWLSRFIAVVLLALYALLILFQLKTHTYLFEGEADDEDDEPGIMGFWGGLTLLAVLTFFISLLSDLIVDAIEGAAQSMGMPILFLSGILVPIVGNAAEHAASVTFAYRNKMEIALGSAVGSAVQISVFVIPLVVVYGWILDKPMTMNFHVFETAVMLLTTMSIGIVLMDGKSNWLKGALLLMAYLIIGAAFWAHADPSNMD